MFRLSSEPLDAGQLKTATENPACGALVTFEGWVRNHNEGHAVTSLEYEAYDQLAVAEGNRILGEAIEKFDLKQAVCVHRTGHLAIGDIAVWVGVATPHRDAAFKACRYIIDEIKVRVPIWKKEHYVNGDSGWVNCEECAKHGHQPQMDYSRQTALKAIGPMGQRKLAASRVLVVGAGGLGCPVLAYLAGAGVGHLGIVEHDRLEASNLHRQFLYAPDQTGESKAALASEWLRQYNPAVEIESFDMRFQQMADQLSGYDIIVECTDCMDTKLLVNRAALKAGIPVVFASIYQFEGQLQVVTPDTSCLECLYEGGAPREVPSCSVAGVVGPVPGVLGSMQALETIKQLLQLDGRLKNELLIVNLSDYGMRRIALPRNPSCPAHQPDAALPASVDITVAEIPALGPVNIVDIRNADEVRVEPLACDHVHIPMDQLLSHPELLDREQTHLLVCAAGVRTQYTANALRSVGYRKVYSLIGGNRMLG